MGKYEQIRNVNVYLKLKYQGYIGVPMEYLEHELLAKRPLGLRTSSKGFYGFLDVAEAVCAIG